MEQESTSPVRKRLIAGALALGTVLGAAGIASAVTAEDPATTTDGAGATADSDGDEHGASTETPLSGAQADAVTAAAEAAVPGGSVTKVEQEGTEFEAHVTDGDGNEVEVHFDADLNVLEIEQGH